MCCSSARWSTPARRHRAVRRPADRLGRPDPDGDAGVLRMEDTRMNYGG